MANLICPKCDKNYDSDKLRVYKCPDCRKWLNWDTDLPAEKYDPNEFVRDDLRDLDAATIALISATNRTTYAIRSLAIFLFTTLCTSVLGYVLISAGASAALRCDSYSDCGSGFVIWGFVIVALGFIVGLGAGVNELGKSKP